MIVLSGDALRRFTFRRDFFSFRYRDSRMLTYDPQIPPYTSAYNYIFAKRTGIPLRSTAIPTKNGKRAVYALHPYVSNIGCINRIATLGAARDTSLEFLFRGAADIQEQEMDIIVCNSMGIRSQAGK